MDKFAKAINAFLAAETWDDAKDIVGAQGDVLLDPIIDKIMSDGILGAVSKDNQWEVMKLQISRRILDDCRTKGIADGFDRWLKPESHEYSLSLYKQFVVLSSDQERVKFRIQYPEIEVQLIHLRNAAIGMDLQLSSYPELSDQLGSLYAKLRATNPLIDTYKWAYIKNYIGKVLALSQETGRVQHLQDAIQHWMAALEMLQPNLISEGMLWAEIQVNLAMAYTDNRMSGSRIENFRLAQSCNTEALKIYSRKFTPFEWGTTQVRIAQVYIEHPQQDFPSALQHMKTALHILTQYSEDPLLPAKIEADLGSMYLASKSGYKSEHIEEAIEHFQKALQIFIQYGDEDAQREAYLELGDAYVKRIAGDPTENREKANQYLKKGQPYE